MLFIGQKELLGTEFYLKNVLDLNSVFVQKDIILMTTTVPFLIQFETEHKQNISKTALPEFLRWNTVVPYQNRNILFVSHGFFHFKLFQSVHKRQPCIYSKQLYGIHLLIYRVIELSSHIHFFYILLNFLQKLNCKMT